MNNKTTFFEKKQINEIKKEEEEKKVVQTSLEKIDNNQVNVFLYKEQEEVIVVFQILSEFLVGYFL